jgi:hypothetical protein
MRHEALRRLKLVEEFGGACQRCGYNRCTRALQFHHKDASEKALWSKRSGRASTREVAAHPERFILLCANCHFEEHDALDELNREMLTCPIRGKYCSLACGNQGKRVPLDTVPVKRFWSKVDKTGDCWLWIGDVTKGYATMNWRNESGRYTCRSAARVSYMLAFGEIPAGADLRHSCGIKLCVNPDHLVPEGQLMLGML